MTRSRHAKVEAHTGVVAAWVSTEGNRVPERLFKLPSIEQLENAAQIRCVATSERHPEPAVPQRGSDARLQPLVPRRLCLLRAARCRQRLAPWRQPRGQPVYEPGPQRRCGVPRSGTRSRLQQRRGHVLHLGMCSGRSGQRAYAYLFHPRDQVLTEEAYERLRTIGEATDLGSGFKIRPIQ